MTLLEKLERAERALTAEVVRFERAFERSTFYHKRAVKCREGIKRLTRRLEALGAAVEAELSGGDTDVPSA